MNTFGDTPLHVAVRNLKFDCIDALLVMRSRTDLANFDNHKPLELASAGDWDKSENKFALRAILERRVVSRSSDGVRVHLDQPNPHNL